VIIVETANRAKFSPSYLLKPGEINSGVLLSMQVQGLQMPII
jgi:hypothetical protein